MRFFVFLCCLILSFPTFAQTWEDQRTFGNASAENKLTIISSTDTSFFAPVIVDFLKSRPETRVDYNVTGTADLDRIFRAQPEGYDLVISSAMDLQFKLANDGFARKLDNIRLPDWAKWRDSIFAFTSEPATIVINKSAFAGHPIPKSRQDLIRALRDRPELFRNKVGTYDVRSSGLGYLFATQDARASDTFWRLMEVIGGLNVNLYCCSGEMIDDLVSGKLSVAYNVLGSYAAARKQNNDVLEIILPSDYPTTMMRTAMVSFKSDKPDLAAAFVSHLIKNQSKEGLSALPPLMIDPSSTDQITITLDPALLTYLDELKRRSFLAEWESAVIQSR